MCLLVTVIMMRKSLTVFFLVTITLLLLSLFGDGMVSTGHATLLAKYLSDLYGQPSLDGEPYKYQNTFEEFDRSTLLVVDQKPAGGKLLAHGSNNATIIDGYQMNRQNENKNANDCIKSGEGIGKLLDLINTTDAEWKRKVDICYTYDKKKSPISEKLQEERQCKKRLPEALLIGVKKCGTGTLSRYLDLHPAVSMSREINFPGRNVTNDSIAEWIQRMPLSSPYQLPMTENPAFCCLPSAFLMDLKPHLLPHVKFVFILRDPVQRAISDYLHLVAHSNLPRDGPFDVIFKDVRLRETFEKTILEPDGTIVKSNVIRYGVYINAVQTTLNIYRRDQIIFIDGDAFVEDPYPSLHKMESFLGLPEFYRRSHFVKNYTKGFYCAHVPERPDFGCMIQSKGRPHPKISDEVLRRLYDYYRPYNQAFAYQFGVNFSWINK